MIGCQHGCIPAPQIGQLSDGIGTGVDGGEVVYLAEANEVEGVITLFCFIDFIS